MKQAGGQKAVIPTEPASPHRYRSGGSYATTRPRAIGFLNGQRKFYISSQEPRIADGWPPYFGFDAVRIPLYLAWRNEQARLGRFVSAWQTPRFGGKPPAWINLKDGSVAPFPSSGGYEAVLALTQFVPDGMLTKPPFAVLTDGDDYYSASFKLLSNSAVREAPLAKRT